MKSLIFNPFSGAAGDMILGCTLDLLDDKFYVKEIIESAVPVSVNMNEVMKRGIRALDVKINVPEHEHSRTYFELVDIIIQNGEIISLSSKINISILPAWN